MLPKLFSNTGQDAVKLYLDYCTSVYLTIPLSIYLNFCVLNLIYLNENSPINLVEIDALQYFIEIYFFKYWIKNNPLKISQKDLSFYMNWIKICSLKHVIRTIQYLSILYGITWCPIIFHWLKLFFLNSDSKTIPRPYVFHEDLSSQVNWFKKTDQK